jgi:RNA polymerase primary sigma factor
MNAIRQEQVLGLQTLSTADSVTAPSDKFIEPPRFLSAGLFSESTLPELMAWEPRVPASSGRSDTFELYLREVGQVKLLTPEEEIVLAERIKHGDNEAREQMIKANLRLVVKIARDFEGLGLPLLDLISEGNIGLIKGVERFRPNKGAKLSTYASWWIKQSIKRALANQSKIIRLPVHVTHKVAQIRTSELKLRETLEREATDEEIADDIEVSPRRLKRYRDASLGVVSLDSATSNEDSTPLWETIADENTAAPFDELAKDNDNGQLHKVLAMLDPRERSILEMRFGLDDGKSKTLEELGKHFGISRERIRQVQTQALEKMRVMMEKPPKVAGSTLTAFSPCASAPS